MQMDEDHQKLALEELNTHATGEVCAYPYNVARVETCDMYPKP
jgi:hypothetical protein